MVDVGIADAGAQQVRHIPLDGDHFRDRLAVTGDDDFFAGQHLVEKLAELDTGVSNADGRHSEQSSHNLCTPPRKYPC